MKRIAALFTAVLLSAALLLCIGCGDGREELTVLSFRVEDQTYYDWMIEEFESETGCKVNYDAVSTTEYPNVLTAKLRASAVDVFGSQSPYLGDEGIYTKMLELDGLAYLDGISAYAKSQSQLGGKWFISPLNVVTFVVFYNKDVFKTNSLEVPTTWNEFMEVCETLNADASLTAPVLYCGRDSWPINMITDALEYPIVRAVEPDFYVDVWKNGTQRFDEAGGLYEEYFDRAKELLNQYVQESATGAPYNSKPRLFASGKFGMTMDGSWAYKDLAAAVDGDFEIGTFLLPASDVAANNTKAVSKMGGGWSIASDSAHVDLAKKFLEFQMRTDVYQRYLDEIQMDSVVEGMSTSVQAVKDIYRFDTVLSFENYKINGFVYNMADTYGPAFIAGTQRTSDLLAAFQKDNDNSKNLWSQQSNLDNWLMRFHSDKVTA